MDKEDDFDDNIGILKADSTKKTLETYFNKTEGSDSSDESSKDEIEGWNNDCVINVDSTENDVGKMSYSALVEDEEDILAYENDEPLSGNDSTSEYGDFMVCDTPSTTRNNTSIPPLKPGYSRGALE